MNQKHKERNAIQVMFGLIGMVKPLIGFMLAAVCMGTLGHLAAAFITILGGAGIGIVLGFRFDIHLSTVFAAAICFAVFRGILRYLEQAGNHYIAFKLLARIRHKVFANLRKLAPAKLDGSEKGNLISIITSDIELLEVFYAHTISPAAIAVLTSLIMYLYISHFHLALGLIAVLFYGLVGIIIPVANSRMGQGLGREYRRLYGELNTAVLDNLYGLDEIIQYGQQKERLYKMDSYTLKLEQVNKKLKFLETVQRIATDTVILAAGVIMAIAGGILVSKGSMNPAQAILCTAAMLSSFGPTAELSALSNNLNQTLASGNRVLDLLEEKPVITDILKGCTAAEGDIQADAVSFSYKDMKSDETREVLSQFSLCVKENTIHGILGKSGCGKSTLLKLFMRFYETECGTVKFGDADVNEIETAVLRNHISYVTQDTFLFQDTVENNIKVADEKASRKEVTEAAKKAAIHEFIMTLPNGYDTKLAELGDSVSGGERQRIGLARAFLHQSKVILLDEPTSNIDSLNEGIILKSLKQERKNKTMVLVSHRASTMAIADNVTRM